MATGDLTTVAAVEAWGKIPSGSGDALIATLISAASAWITSFCERSFAGVVSVTEIRHGNGKSEMNLAESPIASITSLQIGNVVVPAQVGLTNPGYFLIPSNGPLGATRLAMVGYRFERGTTNVFVTYTAGWSSVPLEIVQACNELVVSAYRRGTNGPDQKSLTVNGQTTAWNLVDMPPVALAILEKYRKVIAL